MKKQFIGIKNSKNPAGIFPNPASLSRIVIIAVMILLLTPIIEALGVTPGRTSLYFKESLEKEVKFTILNNERKDLDLAIYIRGDLEDYIELPQQNIKLTSDEASKDLTYKIKLPKEIKEPGLHGTEIVIREITVGKEEKEITIGTMQAVITQLHVHVPYPGKYIVVTRLDVIDRKEDNEVLFFVPLINFGEEDVKSAKAVITIMDMYDNVIDDITTDEKTVPAKGRAELSASINSSRLTAGVYRVIAKVTYDGLITIAENAFYTDDFLLIPLDISVTDFTLGDIAKFNILVENIGNKEIKDAFSLMLLNSKGENVANLRSIPTDFRPLEKKELVSYWDTKDVKADEYRGEFILKYENRSDEKGIRTIVEEDSIRTDIIGVTGYAIQRGSEPSKGSSPLLVVVVILVAMNLAWFAYYLTKKGKRPPKGEINEETVEVKGDQSEEE